MRLVRVGIANVNTTVGAVKSNADRAIALSRRAADDGVTVLVYPEQLFAGYAPEDLVQWRAFVSAQWRELTRFAEETKDHGVVSAVGLTVARGAHVYNCAALVHCGTVWGIVPKEKLPTYNVFYEARTLANGVPGLLDEVSGVPFGDLIFELDFGKIALEVCEDIWSPDGPMRRRSYAGAELVLNLSASPFRLGVVDTRREMIATRAGDNQVTVVYANLVGANDGLVFDGGGYVAQNGRLLLDAPRFCEGIAATTVDLDRTTRLRTENTTWRHDQMAFAAAEVGVSHVEVDEKTTRRETLRYPVPSNQSFFLPAFVSPSLRPVPTDEPVSALPRTFTKPGDGMSPRARFFEDILSALALGIGDYFEKTGAFKTIGVALSGGRDSLLCLWLARRYLDTRYASESKEARDARARSTLRAFFMPSRHSSAETRRAAEAAAVELGVPFVVVPIDDAIEPELVGTVLGIAASFGDAALFEAYLAEAKKTPGQVDRVDRERLLWALGQFRDPALVARALDLVLSADFDPRESIRILWAVPRLPSHVGYAWTFMTKNFDALVARLPRDYGAALPSVGAAFCDDAKKPEVEAFFKDRAPLYVGGPRSLAQALEGMHLCSVYRSRETPKVSASFAARK